MKESSHRQKGLTLVGSYLQPLNGSDRLFVNWILQVQATGMFLVKQNQGTPSSIDELILYTKPFQISSKQ